jgi:hypothetical protein
LPLANSIIQSSLSHENLAQCATAARHCGNTSNARLKEILSQQLANAIALIEAGEKVVEISG